MKLIGLTGGIGSGKTTVAHIFEALGIPIYYADARAKKLMHMDFDLVAAIKAAFGDDVYAEGKLDRPRLAEIVFTNPERLKVLNSLVHPAVGRDFSAWVESQNPETPYILKEAAILVETAGHRDLDGVILVQAPENLRIARVIDRDQISFDQVKARMANQWSDEDRLPFCDWTIQNDGENSLIEQVLEIHNQILSI